MEYRFSGWSTGMVWGCSGGPPPGSEWYISFKKECDSTEEAERLETRARAAVAKMQRTSRATVERLHLAVFVELRYLRQDVREAFGTHDNGPLADMVTACFLDAL